MKRKNSVDGFPIMKCPVCGREFIIHCEAERYAYRYKGKNYCSWTCFRKVEKGKKKLKGDKVAV